MKILILIVNIIINLIISYFGCKIYNSLVSFQFTFATLLGALIAVINIGLWNLLDE